MGKLQACILMCFVCDINLQVPWTPAQPNNSLGIPILMAIQSPHPLYVVSPRPLNTKYFMKQWCVTKVQTKDRASLWSLPGALYWTGLMELMFVVVTP